MSVAILIFSFVVVLGIARRLLPPFSFGFHFHDAIDDDFNLIPRSQIVILCP